MAIDESPEILNLYRDLLEDERDRVATCPGSAGLTLLASAVPDLIMLDYARAANHDDRPRLRGLRRLSPGTSIMFCTGAVEHARATGEAHRPDLERFRTMVSLGQEDTVSATACLQHRRGP